NRDYKSLKKGKMSRHIQFESGLSMTGSNADARIAVKPSEEGPLLISLYNAITGSSLSGGLSTNNKAQTALELVAQELRNAQGAALVVSGSNDVAIQELTNAINAALGSYGQTIDLDNPTYHYKGDDAKFEEFLPAAKAGAVDGACFLNSNPLHDYQDAEAVREALATRKFKLSFADREDETGSGLGASAPSSHPLSDHHDAEAVREALAKLQCKLSSADREDETGSELAAIAPSSNFLESWGDANPREGYYTIVQPTINPVFNTRQAAHSLLRWTGDTRDYYTFVKENWEQNILAGSTKTWKEVLQTGFEYKGENAASAYAFQGDVNAAASAIIAQSKALAQNVEVQLYQSTALRDGKQGNNAYLHELPDPVSKVTWDNYAAINPKFAEELRLGENSLVTVEGENGYSITLPVLLQPGQAMGTVSIAVGYGR